MGSGNELAELYDCLSVLYGSMPDSAESEWKLAVRSVLYGDDLLADEATCYGAQQKNRNYSKRKDYASRYGNGERITEFSEITVSKPRSKDQRYVASGAVLPVTPESGEVLPVKVTSDEIDWAIALLAEFPAEPAADRPGDSVDVLLDPERVRQARDRINRDVGAEETTVLFVSDTHLGYENRERTGSGKTVPWMGAVSTCDAFSQITRIAIDREVDAVIHTGDILDHEVDADTLEYAEGCLDTLSNHGIPVYCIIGSHDHDSANPQHSKSVNGIAWLREQVAKGYLTEISTSSTPVDGGALDAYGVSAGNVGIDDVGKYYSREWTPSDIAFGAASPGPNVLCLHDGVTPYRSVSAADVDLDALLEQSRVSIDCVLVGDEHGPRDEDFYSGYTFTTTDGTAVLYTGPASRISYDYRDQSSIVTELTFKTELTALKRHRLNDA